MQLQRRQALSDLIYIVAHDKSAHERNAASPVGSHTVVASSLIGIVSNDPMTKTIIATSMTGLAYLQCREILVHVVTLALHLPTRYASE